MKRSIAILIAGIAACSLAMAQDRGPSTSVDPSVTTSEAIGQNALVPNLPFPFSKTSGTSASSQARMQPLIVIPQPQILVRDGAVYFEMPGGMRIPFPGGGASGCFTVNLPERVEKLRKMIGVFPTSRTLPRR